MSNSKPEDGQWLSYRPEPIQIERENLSPSEHEALHTKHQFEIEKLQNETEVLRDQARMLVARIDNLEHRLGIHRSSGRSAAVHAFTELVHDRFGVRVECHHIDDQVRLEFGGKTHNLLKVGRSKTFKAIQELMDHINKQIPPSAAR